MRRDLRLKDNAALYHALNNNASVLPVFIFDTCILDQLEDRKDRRVEFILLSLISVKRDLEKLGSSLLILHGDPVAIFKTLKPKNVYTNRDYENYARKRDEAVAGVLRETGSSLHDYKDHVIFDKREVLKQDGTPYTVFTPYSKQWKATLNDFYTRSYPVHKYTHNLIKTSPLSEPTLRDLGFEETGANFPERVVRTTIIAKYNQTRDYPGIAGTSRLGVHLRFGTVSIRDLVRLAMKKNETWLNELIWREFYSMILWHFPHVETGSFKPAYDRIPWRNNEEEFNRWCLGETGYPIVDAGMRELNETGYMHNRVRMIVASFLTKHLLIDWRWGEAYFARKLLDYELASNNGGWQWAAGSGCDAAPYFRIFNPYIQTEKFDQNRSYIMQWVPEVETDDYPKPIVDHKVARERAINTFSKALS